MRVMFVTDLHGRKWKYDRLFETACEIQADVLVNGGDMLPTSGTLHSQGDFIASYLDKHFGEFDAAGIYYLCYLGNDDLRIFDAVFAETCDKYPFVVDLAQLKIKIADYEFLGMNWIVDYPFYLKDRCRMDTKDFDFEEQFGRGLLSTQSGWRELDDWFSYARALPTIEDELDRLAHPENLAQSIYVIHMPPARLGLDVCADGLEVGSEAVYRFLAREQPRLSLHGHIHESPEVSGKWYAKLGRTVCVQPGQLDPLTYVTVDLATMELNRYLVGVSQAC